MNYVRRCRKRIFLLLVIICILRNYRKRSEKNHFCSGQSKNIKYLYPRRIWADTYDTSEMLLILTQCCIFWVLHHNVSLFFKVTFLYYLICMMIMIWHNPLKEATKMFLLRSLTKKEFTLTDVFRCILKMPSRWE